MTRPPLSPVPLSRSRSYGELSAEHIIVTVEKLQERINDRFPDASLEKVAERLLSIARQAQERSAWIARPVYWLRGLIVAILAMFAITGIISLRSLQRTPSEIGLTEFIQLLDSGLNDVVIIGGALFFVATIEIRLKRRRALSAIHELRSIAHIIDMHQLTKDPERLLSKPLFTSEVSPRLGMSQFQLRRYLDYCSELLSLTGKIAALYVQNFEDGVALSSANEVEELTTGLSRKIWQKIFILYTFDENQPNRPIWIQSEGTPTD